MLRGKSITLLPRCPRGGGRLRPSQTTYNTRLSQRHMPHAPPQPNLPAAGQVGLVRQLSQERVAGVGARATKAEKPLVNPAAPQAGHFLAISF